MNEISDEDIVRMFHSGNGEEKAFRLLVGKYSERLYWHIRKIVIGHEDSDDVLHLYQDLEGVEGVSLRGEIIYMDVSGGDE